jgi:SAM-dependent methyltransferase
MSQSTPVFDPVQYKNTTRDQWQAAAAAWDRWGPTLHAWLGEATELMLDMARVGPGQHVLDVAAGAGEQTTGMARRVGPSGSVLATDLSPAILDFARKAALEAGLKNVQTQVMDGENLELPDDAMDVVVSRVGLIYFPDQHRALTEMKRVLKPGGRVVGWEPSPTPYRRTMRSSLCQWRSSVGVPGCHPRSRASRAPSASVPRESWRLPIARRGFVTSRFVWWLHRCSCHPRRSAFDSNGSRLVPCTRCWPACPRRNGRRCGRRSSRNSGHLRVLMDSPVPARWWWRSA